MIPHLKGRPLTLVRCPEGYKKQCFYQRHVTESLRDPIRSIRVKEGRSTVSYVAVDSAAGLIALVQMGVLEIHTWGSRQDRLERPDRLIFDLDPDPALPWKQIKEAAETLRDRMSSMGFSAFVKTTGGKGLHVVVPIIPKQDWEAVKLFAKRWPKTWFVKHRNSIQPRCPSPNARGKFTSIIYATLGRRQRSALSDARAGQCTSIRSRALA